MNERSSTPPSSNRATKPATGGDKNPIAADNGAKTTAAETPTASSGVKSSSSGASGSPTVTPRKVQGSFAGGTWIALIVGALLLIVLLAFILQNQEEVGLHIFFWELHFPLGVGMLLASILGGLIMACVGVWRMVQLRRQIREG